MRLVAAHVERFGGLDVLVNSAGIGDRRPARRGADEARRPAARRSTCGSVLVTREAIPCLRGSRGLIVNLASIAGHDAAPGLAVYGATKAAVISLTRSQNAELAGDGIRATALCPGFVDTPMARGRASRPTR